MIRQHHHKNNSLGTCQRWCNVVPRKRLASTCFATTPARMSSEYEEESDDYEGRPYYYEVFPLVYIKSTRDAECLRLVSSHTGDILDDWKASQVLSYWEMFGLSDAPENSEINERLYTLTSFIIKLIKVAKPSVVAFISALLLLERLCLFNYIPVDIGSPGCASKMFLVALMISVKYFDCYTTGNYAENWFHQWAEFGGNQTFVIDLMKMELDILLFLGSYCHISAAELGVFVEAIMPKSHSKVPDFANEHWISNFVEKEKDTLQVVPSSMSESTKMFRFVWQIKKSASCGLYNVIFYNILNK